MPKISVILPVYNGGPYLKLSVESVLNQEFENFELIIVDDCSIDGSREYLEGLTDKRIMYYKNKTNMGLFFNLNFLIEKSTTSLIKLWAQDDIMYPHCITAFVDCHNTFPDIGFSYSGRDIIDNDGKIVKANPEDNTPSIISPELHAVIAYYTGSIAGNIANVCINKQALQEVGVFRTDFKISADFDMWVRLAENHNTAFIKEALIQLRDHKGQLSRNRNYYVLHAKEDLEVYRNLNRYAPTAVKIVGNQMMEKHKLIFYYTLGVKAFIRGDMKEGIAFYNLLGNYCNFWRLSYNFLLIKLKLLKPPSFNVNQWA